MPMSKPPYAPGDPIVVSYSVKDVARIVGLPESRVRYWAQTGFVGPSARLAGKPAYTFQDLLSVKTAKALVDNGISIPKARRSLEALKAQLPHIDRPLTQLRVVSDGERLIVVDDGRSYEPMSGQLLLDFDVGNLYGEVEELLRTPTAPVPQPIAVPEPSTAYGWLVEGLRIESSLDGADPEAAQDEAGAAERDRLEERAIAAYRMAVQLDGDLAAAHTNLGNLLHRRGALEEARAHYERALLRDPDQPEARYNLGNLLDDLGDTERAVGEWYRVVQAHDNFADAHFNLGVALLRLDAPSRARVHLQRYLALEKEGEWAERARDLLAATSP